MHKITKFLFTILLSLSFFTSAHALNNVLDFDGVDDYVDLGNNFNNLGEFTFEASVYWRGGDGVNESPIFVKPYVFSLTINTDSKMVVRFGNGVSWTSEIISNSTLPKNYWNYIAVTRSSSNEVYMFKNSSGASSYPLPIIADTGTNTEVATIGARKDGMNNYVFDGMIDEVRIWNDKRESSELLYNKYLEMKGNEANLIAYYNFNQVSGTTLNDSQTNVIAKNGTLEATMTNSDWIKHEDFFDNTHFASFDGIDDYVVDYHLPAGSAIPSVSMEAWIKTSKSIGIQNIQSLTNDSNSLQLRLNDGKLQFLSVINYNTTGTITSANSITDGNWHHVAAVKDGTTATLYIDGIEVVQSASGSISNVWFSKLSMGIHYDYNNGLYYDRIFKGKMDEVRVWYGLRTQQDIQDNMNHELDGNETNLEAYYDFSGHYPQLKIVNIANIGKNGQLKNGILVKSFSDKRFKFDGSNDYISLGDILDNQTSLTYSVWVYWKGSNTNSTNRQYIFSKDGVFELSIDDSNNNTIYADFGDGSSFQGGLNSTSSIIKNSWTHIAVTRNNSGDVVFYINGIQAGTGTNIASGGNSAITKIAYNNTNAFNGILSELATFNKTLNPSEIIELSNGKVLRGNEKGLVGYWPLDDIDNLKIKDKSFYTNDGTINGAILERLDLNISHIYTNEHAIKVYEINTLNNTWGDKNYSITGGADLAKFDINSTSGILFFNDISYAIKDNNYSVQITINAIGITVVRDYTVFVKEAILNAAPVFTTATQINTPENSINITTAILAPDANISNSSINLDGSNDFVDLGNTLAVPSTFTFETWIYWKGSNNGIRQGIVSKEYEYLFSVLHDIGNFGKLEMIYGNGTNYSGLGHISTSAIPLNTWTHIAVSRDSSNNSKFYINGKLDSTNVQSASGVNTNANTFIGKQHAYPLRAKLNDLRIWGADRSIQEINTAMHYELNGNEDNLLAYYKFNEINSTSILDSALNKYNGILTNSMDNTDIQEPTTQLSYGIVSGDYNASLFDINSSTGVLSFNSNPNYESNITNFELNISVSDGTLTTYKKFDINVTDINDAPNSINNVFEININANKSFSSSDFSFTDEDSGDSLDSIYISTLPIKGSLKLNGTNVVLNQKISSADISNLVFTPNIDELATPYSIFKFQVYDGNLKSSSQYTSTINVIDPRINLTPIFDTNTIILTVENNTTVSTAIEASDVNISNNVLSLDGNGDYISLPNAIDVAGAITLEAWINKLSTSTAMVVGKMNGGGSVDARYGLRIISDSLNLSIGDGSNYFYCSSPSGSIPNNEWIHIAGRYSNIDDSIKLYINGIEQVTNCASSSTNFNDIPLSGTLKIGMYHGYNQYFNGKIDEVKIWNKGLTSSEINASMNTELNGNENNLVAYYKFDDTSGLNVTDSTSNEYTGTLVGDSAIVSSAIMNKPIYNIVSGDYNASSFDINSSTGVLTFNSNPNYETISNYELNISANDGYFTTYKKFNINLTNVNEAPTDISINSNTISENMISGVIIGSLSVVDEDIGDSVTYTLGCASEGANDGNFSITSNSLKSASVFNYESKSSYEVCVRATDTNGAIYDKNLTINIINENDAPTNINLSVNIIAENSANGTTIGTLSTSDEDTSDSATYTLGCTTAGANDNNFSITSNSLKTASVFNYETKSSYEVCLRVADGNNSTYDKNFSITVSDVNDAPVLQSILNQTKDEDFSDYNISLSATDEDSADTLTYTAESNNTSIINVSLNGGSLSITPVANANGVVKIDVNVSDGNLSDTKSFTITVNAINDAPTITTINDLNKTEDFTSFNLSINPIDVDSDNLKLTVDMNDSSIISISPSSTDWISYANYSSGMNLFISPKDNMYGSVELNVTIQDPSGEKNSEIFVLNVISADDAPIATSMAATVGPNSQDTFETFTPNYSDEDGDIALTLKIESLPTLGSFESDLNQNGTWITINSVPFEVNISEFSKYRFNAGNNSGQYIDINWSVMTSYDNTYANGLWSNTATGVVTIIDSASNYAPDINITSNSFDVNGTIVVINEDNKTMPIYLTYNDDYTPTKFLVNIIESNDSSKVSFTSGDFNITKISDGNISIVITPKANVYGDVNITLGAFDGDKNGTKSFILRINSVNDNPSAFNIEKTINEDNNYSFSSLNISNIYTDINDSTQDSNESNFNIFNIISLPQHGFLHLSDNITLSADTNISISDFTNLVYTPAENNNTDVNFTWKAYDGEVWTNNKMATIHVIPLNDAPIFVGSSNYNITENNISTIAILSGQDIENNTPFTYTKLSGKDSSFFTINDDKLSFSIARDFENPADANSDNFYNVDINITDSIGKSTTKTFNIEVINEPSSITTNAILNVSENQSSVGTINSNAEGTATYSIVNGNDSANFSINSATGELSFIGIPDYETQNSYTVAIQVTDSYGNNSSTQTFTIDITNMNDAPYINSTAIISVSENSIYTYNITASDDDNDTISITTSTLPTWLSFNSTTNILTGTPDINGTFDINVTANDGDLTYMQSFTISVSNVNDAPVLDDIGFVVSENTNIFEVIGSLSASDEDSNIFTYSIVSSDGNNTFSINSTSGIITLEKELNEYIKQNYTLIVNVKDDMNAEDNATITFSVSDEIDAPIANIDNITLNEDSNVSINLIDNDTDKDNNINVGSVVITVSPSHGNIDINAAGYVTYVPNANYFGSDYFTYKISDMTALESNEANVSITINPVNDAPKINSTTFNTLEDVNIVKDLSNYAYDIDGDNLTYTIVSTTTNGSLLLTDTNITYNPNSNFYGFDSFVFKVSDGNGSESNDTIININMAEINDIPVAVNDSNTTNEDTNISINVLSNDSDDGDLNVTSVIIANNPSNGIAVVQANGTIIYSPNHNWHGIDTFTYSVKDDGLITANLGGVGVLVSNTATVSVTVTSVNDTPIANDDSITLDEDNIILMNLHSNDVDIDNTLVGTNITIVTQANHGNITLSSNGLVRYIPKKDFSGTDIFTYKISDGVVNSNVASVDLTINAVNDAPSFITIKEHNITENNTSDIFIVNARDRDDLNSSLTYSIINTKDSSLFNFNPSTKALKFISGQDYENPIDVDTNNIYTVDINVRDDDNASVVRTFNISIIDVYEIDEEDTDGDGIKDGIDTDDDGDGISDIEEGYNANNPSLSTDTDGDGIPDYRDTDTDGDGILDSIEGTTDTDGDGIPDYKETDTDDDGIDDSVEFENNLDSDGDGIPNYKDSDSDNDGVIDGLDGLGDIDGDGIESYKDASEIDPDKIATLNILNVINISNFLGTNVSTDEIVSNLNFTEPSNTNGVSINWNVDTTFNSNSSALVIDNSTGVGVITRSTSDDIVLRINAAINKGAFTLQKSFVITILKSPANANESIQRSIDALDWFKIKKDNKFQYAVISDLELITTSTDGVAVSWESTHPAIVSDNGIVSRPSEDTTITLTAEFSKTGGITLEKSMQVRVLKVLNSCIDILNQAKEQVDISEILGNTNRTTTSVINNINLKTAQELNLDDAANLTISYTSNNTNILNINGNIGEVARHTTIDRDVQLTLKIKRLSCDVSVFRIFDLTIKAKDKNVINAVIYDLNDTLSSDGRMVINFDMAYGDDYNYSDAHATNTFIAEDTNTTMISSGEARESTQANPTSSIIQNVLTKLYANGLIENITDVIDGEDIKQNIIRSEKIGATIQRYASGAVDIDASVGTAVATISSNEDGILSHTMKSALGIQTKAISNVKGTVVTITDSNMLKTVTPVRSVQNIDYAITIQTNASGISTNEFNIIDNGNNAKVKKVVIVTTDEESISTINSNGELIVLSKVVAGKQAFIYTTSAGNAGYKFISVGDDTNIDNTPLLANDSHDVSITVDEIAGQLQVKTITPLLLNQEIKY